MTDFRLILLDHITYMIMLTFLTFRKIRNKHCCNIFLFQATLRQEGLITQYKAQRDKAKQMPDDDTEKDPMPDKKSTSSESSLHKSKGKATRKTNKLF